MQLSICFGEQDHDTLEYQWLIGIKSDISHRCHTDKDAGRIIKVVFLSHNYIEDHAEASAFVPIIDTSYNIQIYPQ